MESIKKQAELIVKIGTSSAACFARIIRVGPSGTNEKDFFQLANALKNEIELIPLTDDVVPPF